MNGTIVTLAILAIGLVALLLARSRAWSLSGGEISRLHSRPIYYGAHAAILAILPALIIYFGGMTASVGFIERSVRSSFPADVQALPVPEQNIVFGMVSAIADGLDKMTAANIAANVEDMAGMKAALGEIGVPLAKDPQPYMIESARIFKSESAAVRLWLGIGATIAALFGAAYSLSRITLKFRARNEVERVMLIGLILLSTIAILTTVGIVFSLMTETIHFFSVVKFSNFFFGTVWDPRFSGAGDASSGPVRADPALAGHDVYCTGGHGICRADRAVCRHLHGRICLQDPSHHRQAAA